MQRALEWLAERVLPAPLHRLALRVAFRARRLYRRVARPDLSGISVIVLDDAGRVLLVRHSYGTGQWGVPGGGLARGEAPDVCARREMREELDLALRDLREIARLKERLDGNDHTAHVFAARAAGPVRADGREIVAHRFFPLDALPGDLLPISRARLDLFRQRAATGGTGN